MGGSGPGLQSVSWMGKSQVKENWQGVKVVVVVVFFCATLVFFITFNFFIQEYFTNEARCGLYLSHCWYFHRTMDMVRDVVLVITVIDMYLNVSHLHIS